MAAPHLALDEITNQMQLYAEAVTEALGLSIYSRMDFILAEADNKIYCLEANTLPGMTPTSLLPQMAAATGMSYGALCSKIVELAMKK
jgi:D-alanine-D-alanine ligase